MGDCQKNCKKGLTLKHLEMYNKMEMGMTLYIVYRKRKEKSILGFRLVIPCENEGKLKGEPP